VSAVGRSLVALLALGVALHAAAEEDGQDWDLRQTGRSRTLVAYTAYNNGIAIAVRCADGGLEAVLAGLPAPRDNADTRLLEIAVRDDDFTPQQWNVAIDRTVALSELPAPFARQIREGGRLQIRVPNASQDGRNVRYDLTLPPSGAAIDQVLTTCGRPLVDVRDAELAALPDTGLPANVRWLELPRLGLPPSARYGRGFSVISCMTRADGGLRDCVIESDHPSGSGFGEAALRAASRARVAQDTPPGAEFRPVRITFRATFSTGGFESREDRAAAREQRRLERERRENREAD